MSFQSPSAPLSATVCRVFLSFFLVGALCAYADIGCPEGIVVVCAGLYADHLNATFIDDGADERRRDNLC